MTLFSLSWIHQGTAATPSPTPATSRIDLAFGNTFMVFVIFCLAFQFYRVRQFLHEKWPATFESDPSLTPPASPPLKCKCTLYYALDMLSPLLSQPFSQVQHNTMPLPFHIDIQLPRNILSKLVSFERQESRWKTWTHWSTLYLSYLRVLVGHRCGIKCTSQNSLIQLGEPLGSTPKTTAIIAIFDSVGARINQSYQTNKCIFEPISSEPIISIINARRAIILTFLGSHERVDMRPTKKWEKYGVYIVPQKTRILPRIFITWSPDALRFWEAAHCKYNMCAPQKYLSKST